MTRGKELIDDSLPQFPIFYYNLVSDPSEGVATGTTDTDARQSWPDVPLCFAGYTKS